jgi:hypothetical protein
MNQDPPFIKVHFTGWEPVDIEGWNEFEYWATLNCPTWHYAQEICKDSRDEVIKYKLIARALLVSLLEGKNKQISDSIEPKCKVIVQKAKEENPLDWCDCSLVHKLARITKDGLCECAFWCRTGVEPRYQHLKGKEIPFVVTNHHPHCEHYNDSLIDVWKVQYGTEFYYTEHEPIAEETESGEIVTKEKMHKEVFEQLPEFEGF